VTGGAGFIGSHLVEALVARGDEVMVIDDLSTGRRDNLPGSWAASHPENFVVADIRDRAALSACFARFRPDVVFHLAARARIQPSFQDPLEHHDINVTGTLNLLDLAVRHGVRKFIFSSSSSIYGRHDPGELPLAEAASKAPGSPYSHNKFIGEQYLDFYGRLGGLETVCLRYFNVYGERQLTEGTYATVIGIFLRQLAAGEPFTIVGDGEQRRDFTYVKDVAAANLAAAEPGRTGTYNIGTGENHSINEIAAMISVEHPRVQLPPRPGEYPATLADSGAARERLGWKPSTRLPDWLRRNQAGVRNG